MGCDIHAIVEANIYENYWTPVAKVNLDRNYSMFSLMAGVRQYDDDKALFTPRGLPEFPSYETVSDNTLWVLQPEESSKDYGRDEGTCTLADAVQWVKEGSSRVWDYDRSDPIKMSRITHPDWHSHSWLTTAEMKRVLCAYRKRWPYEAPSYKAVVAMMKVYGEKARLVFWFDN